MFCQEHAIEPGKTANANTLDEWQGYPLACH
jgi:hypothetical protein